MATCYLKSSYTEIELPGAEFGDEETFSRNQTIEHTYSGKAYVYEHGYPVWRYSLTFTGLTWREKEAFYAFWRTQAQGSANTFAIGMTTEHATIKDWPAIKWIQGCRFSSPALTITETLDGVYDIAVTVERVSTATGDILRLPSGYKVV